jgi:CHAD domain-containing protein
LLEPRRALLELATMATSTLPERLPVTMSFAIPDEGGDVAAVLEGLGLRAGPPRAERLTLLDTFDGRLQRAGLRLAVHESDETVLVVTGAETVEVRLTVAARPTHASELPALLRARLEPLIETRALLTQLEIVTTTRAFVERNDHGAMVVTVTWRSPVALVDGAGRSVPAAVIEVAGVLGHPKPARRVVDALTASGLVPFRGDALEVVAATAGIDTTGFSSSATVPLDPAMRAVDGVAAVLANLAATIDANWQGTVEHVDPEFLHDLRIAVRRSRTVLTEAKTVLPTAVRDLARERFAGIGAATGPARDLDVYLIEWDRYTRPLGAATAVALEPVRAVLAERQSAAHDELDVILRSPESRHWADQWPQLLAELGSFEPPAARADRPLGPFVAKRIRRAHHRLVEHGRAIDESSPAERVHDLRKDAKRLRYLLECFGSILPERPRGRFVKRLKQLQDNLGEHQDAEVHVALIREVATVLHGRGASAETLFAMGQLAERLDGVRAAARAEFAVRFGAFDTSRTETALDDVLEGIGR